MKFTDGYWRHLPGVTVLRPRDVADVVVGEHTLTVYASTVPLTSRGDTLNRALVTVSFHSPMDDVIGVRIEHHLGGVDRGPSFDVARSGGGRQGRRGRGAADGVATFQAGGLTARVSTRGAWHVEFEADGRVLTSSTARSVGVVTDARGDAYVHEQLDARRRRARLRPRRALRPVRQERPDRRHLERRRRHQPASRPTRTSRSTSPTRATASSSTTPARVSFEVGSEAVSRVQFSVPGEALEYFVIHGPTPKEVLRRYTALTGRPALPPGLVVRPVAVHLLHHALRRGDRHRRSSTAWPSATCRCRVFHFDCFWMREFHWCDFTVGPATSSPTRRACWRRLTAKGLQICVWINPYIAQRSAAVRRGPRRPATCCSRADGDVWQWDQWQAGMALRRLHQPRRHDLVPGQAATRCSPGRRLLQDRLRRAHPHRRRLARRLRPGADAQLLHVPLQPGRLRAARGGARRGRGGALRPLGHRRRPAVPGALGRRLRRRRYESMAEIAARRALAGAVAASASGATTSAASRARRAPRCSSAGSPSACCPRTAGCTASTSYRVPWAFDEEAVDVARHFTRLKRRLMPYLLAAAGRRARQRAAR